jgi:hypothetical protein
MGELKDYALIWERRCGRGLANQIYLANIKMSLEDSLRTKGGPLDAVPEIMTPETETDDISVSNYPENEESDTIFAPAEDTPDAAADSPKARTEEMSGLNSSEPFTKSKPAGEEPPSGHFLNLQNGGSRNVKPAVQEPPNPPPSYLDLRKKDLSQLNQSQSRSSQYGARADTDGQDRDALNALIEQAELDSLEADDAKVIKDAIERLFYTQNIKIGGAVYPNDRIRANLWRLDGFVVQDAVTKITSNTSVKIRNSSAYVVSVLFNTIMESGSDLLVDPYLNSLRAAGKPAIGRSGGG